MYIDVALDTAGLFWKKIVGGYSRAVEII